MKRLEARVFGSVQGIGFRAFVKKKAENCFLKGFVQNKPDGSVEIVAEGLERDLTHFLDAISKGPFLPQIRGFETKMTTPTNLFVGFEIR